MPILGIAASSQSAYPLPPVSGYSLWLDANDPTVFSYSSGSVVSQWNDKSVNAYHFTEATVAEQPTRDTNQQNGRAVVSFAADQLKNLSLNWGSSASTLFIVAKEDKTAGTGFQNLFTTNATTGQWGYGIQNDPGDNIGMFDVGQAFASFGVTMTNGNADVLVFKSAGLSGSSVISNLYKNGTAAGANPLTLNNTAAGTGASLGSPDSAAVEPFYGYVCEVILYPSQLNDTDRNSVESFLKTKWGTP
jgi:hypothetical protein